MAVPRLTEFLQGPKKWKIFGIILLLIAVVGTVLSMLTRVTFLADDASTRPRLAVVAPQGRAEGRALKQGAQLFVEQLNADGGYKGRPVELLAVEESADAAAKVAADKRVVGVVGYLDAARLQAAAPVFAKAKLPLVTPQHLSAPLAGTQALGLDPAEEARFIANYARNIMQQRLMYVVREADPAFDAQVNPFLEVYSRFDTPVQQVWTLPANADDAAIQATLAEVTKIDVGSVFLATRPETAARLVTGIRQSGVALEVFGTAPLATASFMDTLRARSGKDAALQAHGIVAATPVLFDTANDEAQRFQTRYQQAFKASPDWLATYAYDAARLALAGGEKVASGITGELSFVNGQAQLPIQIGVYNGDNLISAPTQLSPIAKGASFNYIDALRQGRVLYVNDRFMFKTNVVYVGFTVNEIANVDRNKETATLDLSVWFRYRGKFDPQDLQIVNALGPVKFDKPEEVKESDDVQYRRYRIRQEFRLNFTKDARAYNHHVAGLTFRHRLLNRSNLMYVVDVLGMPTGDALQDDLKDRRALKAGSGWMVDNAWVSQNLVRERGDGAPQYVGMTGEQPLFSTITLGVLVKPEALTARDLIPGEFFIYIAIFGLIGAIAAILLDARKLVRFWALQSWLLRVIFWPMLLLAAGNLAIDWAFAHWTPGATKKLVVVYESLWWLMGARLVDMAVRRFVWTPLEERAGRKVPNVMKFLVTILVFVFAFAGITAVVLNQTLTSLLATSGVLAMIIGFAVQANIANIFSGIILNIERPFRVGDFIKINNVVGEVKDITWRTIRVEASDGQMVSLANSKVSEAFMENFSVAPNGIAGETMIYTPAEVEPERVLPLIREALAEAPAIIGKDDPRLEPGVRYKGIINLNGQWVASYSASYRVKSSNKKGAAAEQVWSHVRARFVEQGIPLTPGNGGGVAIVAPAKQAG
jgi:small-conductance mechanosensitive channel/ABC-type branched-subunit amino acid transport system substrate-binding protein